MNYVARNTRYQFGTNAQDEHIYITMPTWDCDWYWSFGYLGNSQMHYHLQDYANGRNINMYDALSQDYKLEPHIKANLWLICELALTAYSLRNVAGIYKRGGSHMATNVCRELIKNPTEVIRINEILLPAIFTAFENLLTGEQNENPTI